MKEELISVIVPVYNVEKYLSNCIESIINQSYKNLEIILIDDGSTDNCGKICDQYSRKDKRIRVIHKENGGLSDARNIGIDNAKGNYITFVDSDDDLDKDFVEYLFTLLKKYNANISICPLFVKRKDTIVKPAYNKIEKILTKKECIIKLLCDDEISVSACSKLYKKSLFKNIKFPLNKLCEDNGTTYKTILLCDKIAFGNIPKYNYYVRQNSIMTSEFNVKRFDLLDLTDMMCKDIDDRIPDIEKFTTKRRVYSRFSILRQLSYVKMTDRYKNMRSEIIDYLKSNKKIILKGKEYDIREKIGIITLLFGIKIFNISWKLYNKIRFM